MKHAIINDADTMASTLFGKRCSHEFVAQHYTVKLTKVEGVGSKKVFYTALQIDTCFPRAK